MPRISGMKKVSGGNGLLTQKTKAAQNLLADIFFEAEGEFLSVDFMAKKYNIPFDTLIKMLRKENIGVYVKILE